MAGNWQWHITNDVKIGVTTSRRDQATSTVVISNGSALLVDPNWDPDELAWIAEDLTAVGIAVTAGFATHAHHDHVLWHPGLGAVPRWASRETARQAAVNRAQLVEALGSDWPVELADLVGRVTGVDGTHLPRIGTAVEMITHDAHAKGHTALWIPAAGTLIAGDMLSNVELPLLEESSPADYADGLAKLRPFVDRAQVVIPGHGNPAVGNRTAHDRWVADNRYLTALVNGADPQDSRRQLPGMREAHAHNRSKVQR